MIHEIKINGYKPTPTKIPLGTAESYGNEVLHLVGDEMWEGLLVSATFHNADVAVVVYADDGYIKVPAEATAKPTKNGIIVITGIGADNRVYTVNLGFIVHDHAEATGTDPVEPTPGQVEQLERIALSASESASSAAVSAEQARRAAEDVAPAVTEYLAQFHEQFKGDPGKDGKDGRNGVDGKDGRDGRDGRDGVDGKDGEKGEKGDPGEGMEIPTIVWGYNDDGSIHFDGTIGAPIINMVHEEEPDADMYWYLSDHGYNSDGDETVEYFSYVNNFASNASVFEVILDSSGTHASVGNYSMFYDEDSSLNYLWTRLKTRFETWDGGAY